VLGNEQPFFAPIAAVVTLGLSLGQRGRRAFEIALGVALGLGIADLLVRLIGVGALQIGIVVVLAMAAAVLLEHVMNSIGNALGMRETEIARGSSRPCNPHFYGVFAQVHNTL
jgi:uncharacterized membrane protein YgaE (UPF0421/DUF939 family)